MSWEVLTSEDVLSEFTVAEASSIRSLQGSGSGSGLPFGNIDVIVATAIDEVRGYIIAGGYPLPASPDNALPAGLFADAIAIARWRLLIATPSFKQLQTDERKEAFELALKKLALISQQQFAIEPPTPDVNPRSGNWNAENKLIMRTHPIPTPATQFTPQTDAYANPGAPADRQPAQFFTITVIDQLTKTITVTGNASAVTGTIAIVGSTANDRTYNVVSATFTTDHTDIVVLQSIPDATADGQVQFQP